MENIDLNGEGEYYQIITPGRLKIPEKYDEFSMKFNDAYTELKIQISLKKKKLI